MKQLFFLFITLSIFSFKSFAQKDISQQKIDSVYKSFPKVDSQYEFSEIVVLDSSFTKEVLYTNAELFFTDEFKSAINIIQYDNKEQGKIIGKGNLLVQETSAFVATFNNNDFYVNFSLEIFCKDGKYKYRIYDITIDHTKFGGQDKRNTIDEIYSGTLNGSTKKLDKKAIIGIADSIHKTISYLKLSMARKQSKDDF
ncbi:MAG TPA: DUF4468 domain-containing protein [Ferruginibacter sp.]|nr:DUF4468 domain-containing protein [Ferruginibacter sp.]